MPTEVPMLKLLGRRLLTSIPLLVIVSFGVFFLVDLAPGDAATTLAGEAASVEDIAKIRSELGLDRPLLPRYWDWLSHAARGDFGESITSNEPETTMIAERLPVTLSLGFLALLLSTVLGLVFGMLAALRPNGVVDRLVTVFSSIAVAVPSFWMGLLLVLFFAVNRNWFPAIGYAGLDQGLGEWLRHLTLPAISLAGLPAAELARQLRGSLVDTLDHDYIMTARAKGLRFRSVFLKHALKNAAIPPVTVLGFRIAQMLGGAVVIETMFVLPGVGRLAVSSVLERDFVTVQTIVVFTTLVVVAVNLVVDLTYAYFNPKLRAG